MRRIVVVALSVMLALVVAIPIASGKPALPAISNNSQTLGELGAEWWTRVIEEPVPTNPLFGLIRMSPRSVMCPLPLQNVRYFSWSGQRQGTGNAGMYRVTQSVDLLPCRKQR